MIRTPYPPIVTEHKWRWKETNLKLGGNDWICRECGLTVNIYGSRPEGRLRGSYSEDCDVEKIRSVMES